MVLTQGGVNSQGGDNLNTTFRNIETKILKKNNKV